MASFIFLALGLLVSCMESTSQPSSNNTFSWKAATVTFSVQPAVFRSGGDNPTRKLNFFCEPGPEFTVVEKTSIGRNSWSGRPIIYQESTETDYAIPDHVLRPRVKSVVINKVNMTVSFELENPEPEDAEYTYYCEVRGTTLPVPHAFKTVYFNITDSTSNRTVPVTDNSMSTSSGALSTATMTLSSTLDGTADRNVTSQAPQTRRLNTIIFLGTISTLLSGGLI